MNQWTQVQNYRSANQLNHEVTARLLKVSCDDLPHDDRCLLGSVAGKPVEWNPRRDGSSLVEFITRKISEVGLGRICRIICMRRWVLRARLVLPAPAKTQTAGQAPIPAAADAAATNDSLADVAGAFKSISSIQVKRLCEEKLCTCGRRRSSEYSAVQPGEFLELGVG